MPPAAPESDTAALLAKLRAEIEELKTREAAALKAKEELDADLQIAQSDAADAKSQLEALQKQLQEAQAQRDAAASQRDEKSASLTKAEEARPHSEPRVPLTRRRPWPPLTRP